jgi:acyl-CoA thioester hydrolase
VFETRHRVRFRDVDPYGHMNMAYYLTYFSDHRFDGMRLFVDLDFKGLEALPIAFHIARAEVEYLRPLFADQEFVIRSHISELKRGQCMVDFEMTDAGPGQQVVSRCRMRIGCIDKTTGRPTAWPAGLMERFFT